MPLTRQLNLYAFLAKLPGFKTRYIAKIMLVAFIGIHVPLITLLISFLITRSESLTTIIHILSVALIVTLLGTVATLYALNYLLAPVILTSAALKNYLDTRTLAQLPTGFRDEAGTLMGNTYQTLHQLDGLIDYMTHYDALTGLPNAELLQLRLEQTIAQFAQQRFTITMVGINEFSNLCDRREPDIVSQLLKSITYRLQNIIDSTDELAYCSSGVFTIVSLKTFSFEEIVERSQIVLKTLNQPYKLTNNQIQINVNLGIRLSSLDETPVENQNSRMLVDRLIQQANMTLRAAQIDRQPYQFYSSSLNQKLQRQIVLENDLHSALERQEIRIHYQPIVNLQNGEIIGVEALMRWQHPKLGWVSPDQFIPIAEANGLIQSLGSWVLKMACLDSRAWRDQGLNPIRMSVNLSTRQLEYPDLLEHICQILNDTEIPAADLELEITETALMGDIERSVDILTQLRKEGISLALDDFGTGHSSLSYLKRFPVNMIKIDRSFVTNILQNPHDAAIARTIISLAHSLNLNITVEGIETKEQLEYFKLQDCQEGQGFYFSRGVSAEAITKLLQRQTFNYGQN
jgi:EAL domain-containing protein (putative c-di-GMP-specific phosphodiesterase class I)/GGDEF domain-containing protein